MRPTRRFRVMAAAFRQAGAAVEPMVESNSVIALCAQVLMAGAKSWEEDKQPFTFGKVSDPFMKTMQLIGVNIDHLLAQEIRQ